jgi:putative spermidine/putrescine transport system permease protein
MLRHLAIRVVAVLCLGFLALPLFVIIASSMTTTEYLMFPPEGLTLKWYGAVLSDATYVDSFLTSTWLAVCATAIGVAIAVPASLAMARYRFPGKAALNAIFSAPMVLPYLVLGSALLQYTGYLGFSQTFSALLVGHVLIVTPFVMKSLSGLFTQEHLALERASADLGATPWVTFRTVTLPLMKPGLISGSIFGFITSWINVELSMFNTTAVLNTIPVQLFNYVQYSVDPSIAAVSAFTIFISVIVITLLDIFIGLDIFSSKQQRDKSL